MLKHTITVKNAFTLVNNGGKHFVPGHSRFSSGVDSFARNCDVYVCYNDKRANAKVSLAVLSLNIKNNDDITFEINGENEQEVLDKLLEIRYVLNVI